MQTIAFYVLCFLSREKLWARWSFASGCWKRPQPPPLQLRGQLGFFRLAGKNDFTRFYKILYQRRWGGRLTGRAELCKLATFQKNTLLSVAVSNSSVPKWLLRKPCSASCAVETVAIASEGKIARKHNSAPVACLCQCRGASRCQTGTPAACNCLTTVSRKGTPPITKIDFFRALQNVICHQN